MPDEHGFNRRKLLTALAGLTLVSATLPKALANTESHSKNSRILVAYFSRSGSTKVIAGVIHRNLHTDLFVIKPEIAYPEDYFQTVEQAQIERQQAIKPAIKNNVINLEYYQTIYLGFPIWGTSIPPVVQTFLSTHNFANKKLIPFITHGGYGKGDSEDVLAELAPLAQRVTPLVIECGQERRTTEIVIGWLASSVS